MKATRKPITIYVVAIVQRKIGGEFKRGPMLLQFDAIQTERAIRVDGSHGALKCQKLFRPQDVHTSPEAALVAWGEERKAQVEECERQLAKAKDEREAVIDTSDPDYAQRRSRE